MQQGPSQWNPHGGPPQAQHPQAPQHHPQAHPYQAQAPMARPAVARPPSPLRDLLVAVVALLWLGGSAAAVLHFSRSGGSADAERAAAARAADEKYIEEQTLRVRAKLADLKKLLRDVAPPVQQQAPKRSLQVGFRNAAIVNQQDIDGMIDGKPTTSMSPTHPQWLDAQRVLSGGTPLFGSKREALESFLAVRYVVLLETVSQQPPVYTGNHEFVGGSFEGRLHVFDAESGDYEGTLPVSATSSPSLKATKNDEQGQANLDFHNRIRSAYYDAFEDYFTKKK
jgi:hypothetical protein